jgi:hypothetical protein
MGSPGSKAASKYEPSVAPGGRSVQGGEIRGKENWNFEKLLERACLAIPIRVPVPVPVLF